MGHSQRHLNLDSSMLGLLRQHAPIQEIFDNWAKVALQVSQQKVKALIDVPPKKVIDKDKNDLWVGSRATVSLKGSAKPTALPKNVFIPSANPPKKAKKTVGVKIAFSLAKAE